MTAEDILKQTILRYGYKTVHIGRPYRVLNSQFIHDNQVKKLESLIKQYAREKCKEQRELCRDEFTPLIPNMNRIREVVEFAPEPEFD